jgi:glycosyltransferase involved in cell wall biosynthesis
MTGGAGTRVMHVIVGLKLGGAEQVLATVARELSKVNIQSCVASMTRGGPVADVLRAAGVPVFELGASGVLSSLTAPIALRGLVREVSPHVVQGWMYHGNVLAALAVPRGIPIAFNIRHSLPTLRAEKRLTQLIIRLGGTLSGRATTIIYNSERARREHELLGYNTRDAISIRNGFDTQKFRPSETMRSICRTELGIERDDFVVGNVARYHPVKNQRMFLDAAAAALSQGLRARFIVAGRDVRSASSGLVQHAKALGMSGQVIFVDEQRDIPALMNALDVLCLTSDSEGFPNVVGEAMSCGVPVIATDVGDVAKLIGDTGRMVPVADAAALAAELARAASWSSEERRRMSAEARKRIEDEFSQTRMLDSYASLYARLRVGS